MQRIQCNNLWRQCLVVLLAVLSITVSFAEALPSTAPQVVHFGVLSHKNKAEDVQRWQPLFDYLNQQLPRYHFEPSYLFIDELEQAVSKKQFEFVFTNPSHYIILTHEFGLSSPLATLVNDENGVPASQFGGVVVARALDDKVTQLSDLKGKTIAIPSKAAFGAYQMQALALTKLGIDPDSDVNWLEVGQPQMNAIQALLAGKADVAFVRTGQIEDLVKKGQLSSTDIKYVGAQLYPHFPYLSSTRLYPEWAVAAMPDIDPSLARDVTALLLSLPYNSALAKSLSIAGFTIPNDYRVVDELLYLLHLPPYETGRFISFSVIWQQWQWSIIVLASLLLLVLVSFVVRLIRTNRQLSLAQRLARETSYHLEVEHRHLKTLIDTVPDLIWVKDDRGVYLLCNKRFEEFYGASDEAIVGKTDYDFVDQVLADFFRAHDQRAIDAGKTVVNEELLTFIDGHQELCETSKTPMYDTAGKLIGVLGISHDISAHKAAENAVKNSEAMLNRAQALAKIGSWYIDLQKHQLYWSLESYRIFGVPERQAINYDFFLSCVYEADRPLVEQAWHDAANGQAYNVQYRIQVAGRIKWVREVAELIFDAQGVLISATGSIQDITEKKQDEERIHQLAFFDGLTGLPNRSVLMEQIAQSLLLARREHYVNGLLLINIDRFKLINDARGKGVGDAFLQAFSQRLQSLLRAGDVLARISGDEFALMVSHVDQDLAHASRSAQTLAESIQESFKHPLTVDKDIITTTISIGISLYPDQPEESAQSILRQADTALHRAKAAGGNQIAFFEATMGESVAQSFRIERELRDALAQKSLLLYLQPQVNAQGKLVGAEVLVRWLHPERGLVPPGVFIPVAETSDLIVDVGKWVTIESCKLLALQEMANLPIRLSVNLSPRHFRQPNFVSWMKEVLATTGADPTRLTLEITEGLVIDNVHDVIAKMSELHALGIHFSIDDFGTGYSSLAYIKRLPIQELKIDKAFVQDAPTDPNDAALVETILSVAEHLHLQVVAEGVETQEQADFLNVRAKVIHQGYLFGKPESAQSWIHRWHQQSGNADLL